MNPVGITPHTATMRLPIVLLAGIAVFLMLVMAPSAHAHAALETSTPVNGDVLVSAPTVVTARFTEPLEQSYSRLELFDSLGNQIEGTTLTFPNDEFTMSLALPANLPKGTYSVLWRTLSAADGHSAENYFAFTVGSNSDIVPITIPGTATDADSVPLWAKTTSRWAALLGVAALIACWPVWLTVVRPTLGTVRNDALPMVRSMRRFVLYAVIAAVAGSIYALLVQAWALPDGTMLDRVINTLGQTRYGHLWLARIGLIFVLGLVLAACGWWFTRRRQGESALAWLVAAAVTIPFSLISHASAQHSGRQFAVIADATHLAAASVWAGGLAILVMVVLPTLRHIDPATRQPVLGGILLRFSTLALICMATLGLTGFYAGWLHVGNWAALTSTDYGKALFSKLILLAIILMLAGINLFVIERKLNDRAEISGPIWTRRFRWTVTGELVLVILLLAVVGKMTSLQPARDVMIEQSRQISIDFETAAPASRLLLAPGVAGVNHFRLEVSGPNLPTDTEAILRLTIPDNDDLGTKEIQLSRVSGNAFEYHGNELSISADWTITAIIREKGKAPVSAESTVQIGTTPPDIDVPADPWRFRTVGGVTGLALVLIGFAGGIVAIRAGQGTMRKESGGLGLAALVLGVILLFQARIDPVLVNAEGGRAIDPQDVAMVERGSEIYTQQCLSCHGPELRGDGPDSAGMQPPPADFSLPHTMVHADEDLIYWVRNGKQGTSMPSFKGILSDQDILDVLSYVESRQSTMEPGSTSADPASCTVTPQTLDQLAALAGSGRVASTSPNLAVSSDPVDDATVAGISTTTNQLLACTNAVDTMRRLSLFTEGYLGETFDAGIPPGFAEAATRQPVPLPVDQQMSLVAISDITPLEDGRIRATIEINDPANHFHETEAETAAGSDGTVTAQVVFAKSGDQWLIDEIIAP